jgi:uncharacterized protein YgiM (DUF1202 family)
MYKLVQKSILALTLFGFQAYGQDFVCSQPVVSMHKEAGEFSEVVSQLVFGDAVTVLEEGNIWALVAKADAWKGWVPVSSLTKATYPNPKKLARVTSHMAPVYLMKDLKSFPPIFTLPFGANIEVVNALDVQADKWLQVVLPQGEVVYMLRSDVVINPKAISNDELVEYAKSFVGTPYIWGGASCYGVDSSGFMQMLFRLKGVTLPRSPKDQAEMVGVQELEYDDVEPGDLLFFSTNNDGNIDHVGLYTGKGEFIHASTRNTPLSVQIGSFKNQFWQVSLKKCSRV